MKYFRVHFNRPSEAGRRTRVVKAGSSAAAISSVRASDPTIRVFAVEETCRHRSEKFVGRSKR